MRQRHVERLADRFFELGLADPGALGGGARIDQQHLALRRMLAQQGLQPDRIAQPGQTALADDDDTVGGAENDALRRRHPARQIDDDPGEFAAQLVKQHVDRAGIDDQRLGDRRLGREDPQLVA